MERRSLGSTGIEVTRLGLGTLTMSPMQRGLTVEAGADVIVAALEAGIRFLDTAQMYGSYPQVAVALARWRGERPVVATKSAAPDAVRMRAAVEEARTQLGLDVIDVFLLHAVKTPEEFAARRPALDVLLKARSRGWIRAVGASSHAVGTIGFLAGVPELGVLHPMVNRDGFGLLDAPLPRMLEHLAAARRAGKGIYAMKPLGGGHLRRDGRAALTWVLSQPDVDAAAVGMTSTEEVALNVAIAGGGAVDPLLEQRVAGQSRRLFVNDALCRKCGVCVEACDQRALSLVEGKIRVDTTRCVVCGYCAPTCPGFAIRVI